jgi:hypothetical protein
MNDRHDENMDASDARGTPDPQQLLTALSTEHFTLQGARSQTMSESSARASVYGVATFIRLVECGAEDFRYGMAINRIRHYYKELARDRAGLFLLSGHDDATGVFANMGLPLMGRKPFFAFSTAVLVINSVVGGAALAVAVGAGFDAPLGLAAGVGGAAAVVSVIGWLWYADRRLEASAADTQPLFPSPSPGHDDTDEI